MPKHLLRTIPTGARYMLLSALGFSLMAASVKKVSLYGIPVLEIVAARSLISLILSFLDIKRKQLSVWGNNKPLLIARGGVGALALICVYFAISTLPLAEAMILQYLHPIFAALIALLFLKEGIQQSTITCIGLSLLGLIVMLKPDLSFDPKLELPLISVAAALAGAFGSAIAYVLVRKLVESDESSVIIFYFPLIALPVSLLLLGGDFVLPNGEAALLLLMVGIFTQIGQVGLTKAMQTEAAGKATAYSYVQVLFSIILGWFFFSEIPTLATWVGGGLIMAGAVINAIWKH